MLGTDALRPGQIGNCPRHLQYAVVGAPDRKNLWILSRTPEMYEGTYNRLLDTIKEQGFNIDTLVRTPQKRG
jgi:apolipoprotein D and lipocalin family protein